MVGMAEIKMLAVGSGDHDGQSACSGGSFTPVQAVFKNQHSGAPGPQFCRCPPIDFGVRFGSGDILAGEQELEAVQQVKMPQRPVGE